MRSSLVNLIELESLPEQRVGRAGLPVQERARAGEVLGWLGDPRPGVGVRPAAGLPHGLPDLAWGTKAWTEEIPPGPFRMGCTAQQILSVCGHFDFECTLIGAPYRLSRHLITNAQYECFVEAGGYGTQSKPRPLWWSVEGWNWRIKYDITGPEDYRHWESAMQTPNHPRVRVSWYEADAFCRWLDHRRNLLGVPLSEKLRLPWEAEWERAARCLDQREYAWGNPPSPRSQETEEDYLSAHCNWDSKLGRTTAVGLYPTGRSECGALDLNGNVWEWCATLGTKDYQDYDRKVENDPNPGPGEFCVLRGGSYTDEAPVEMFNGAYRVVIAPGFRTNTFGFRVVAVRESVR